MGVGTERWAGAAVEIGPGCRDSDRVGMADLAGLPPIGGGWWLYHSFSAHVTMDAPPWPRNHSASRAGTLVPSPGSVSADPNDHHSGVSRTVIARKAASRRRRRKTRLLGRRRCEPSPRELPALLRGSLTVDVATECNVRRRPDAHMTSEVTRHSGKPSRARERAISWFRQVRGSLCGRMSELRPMAQGLTHGPRRWSRTAHDHGTPDR
jgi:hypothetical protein